MREWKSYFNNRLKYDNPNGFCVIVPEQRDDYVPLYCPVCDIAMQSSDDAAYYRQKQCCQKCGMKWADPDLSKWNLGWRPSIEDVRREIESRKSLPISYDMSGIDD